MFQYFDLELATEADYDAAVCVCGCGRPTWRQEFAPTRRRDEEPAWGRFVRFPVAFDCHAGDAAPCFRSGKTELRG